MEKTVRTGSVCSALKFSGRDDVFLLEVVTHCASMFVSVRMHSANNTCQRIAVVIRYRLFVNLPQRQDKSPLLPCGLNGEEKACQRERESLNLWELDGCVCSVRHTEILLPFVFAPSHPTTSLFVSLTDQSSPQNTRQML